MNTNNAYRIDTDSNNRNVATQMRTTLSLAKIVLPASNREMGDYISHLMVSDAECLRSFEEQEICDKATD